MTQREQALQMLRAAGDRGVHTFKMRRSFIGNPSQRIAELEADGYGITHGPKERLNGTAVGIRYRLVSEPHHAPLRALEPAPTPLFKVGKPARSMYDTHDDEAAA